jgi:hypothetical protein
MSLCSSQIDRLAAPVGSRRPSTQDRIVQYGEPISAPSVAKGNPVSLQSETNIRTDSSPEGSASLETLRASAPPRLNRRLFPDEASRRSHMRYGKLLIEDSSISARYRPISLEPEEVAELLSSSPLAVAESSLRALGSLETDQASLVPDWSIEETLESFEDRLAAPQRSAQLMMRLRAFSELIGDRYHRAQKELSVAILLGRRPMGTSKVMRQRKGGLR